MEEIFRKMVRKILREEFILDESLDPMVMPETLECFKEGGDTLCVFNTEHNSYGIRFTEFSDADPFMVPDEKIRKIIEDTPNKHTIKWGLFVNGEILQHKNTRAKEPNTVLMNIFAVIDKFIKENGVNIIGYSAETKRRRIYKIIFDKFFKNIFSYYTAKEQNGYNIYWINKKLMNNEGDNNPASSGI